VAYGPAAAAAAVAPTMPPGSSLSVEIHEIFAHGPLVSTYRTDTIRFPGQPAMTPSIAGVHIVKDGKIAWESVGFDPEGFKNALEQATK
jgi:limonene-1,2-epoxide hydrolase